MNWWRAGKRPEDQAFDPEGRHGPEVETAAHKPGPILSLQRAVGNQAVQKLLSRSEGEPIVEGERQKLETAFGQDLSDVRIHRDQDAAELAAGAGANALTAGRDIYFAHGAYSSAPLAHEVSHVLQQSQATSSLPGEDAFLEHQADRASSAVMSGHPVEIAGVASVPLMQRQAAPGAPPPPMELLPSDSLTLDNFDVDKFALSGTQKQRLDEFAEGLKGMLASSRDSIVSIVGYADAPGTDPHNLALGQQRADAVRAYLIGKGIAGNQLHACSLGEGLPVVMSKGYEAKNRRVEINVVERKVFKPSLSLTPPAPMPAPPVAAPKPIDLTYHPKEHDPTPGEELQEKLRQVDKAVREAQAAEKSNPEISAADLAGRVLRNAAKKLGLPPWIQDEAESIGKALPAKGAQAVVDEIAGERGMDANTRNALKALVEALMRTKFK